ncbi:MAG TPA: DUF805 domain-containing protein [Caulobacteraceae bacterium]|nr:DUF805 domain-containing protein [Caulobacteraceae bacterium]
MGAFGEFFGFDGRLDRLRYLLRILAMALVVTALTCGALWATQHMFVTDGLTGATGFDGEIITGGFLIALGSGFALTTRRLRDMGLEPAHIVPLYAALWVVNAALLEPMSRLDPRDFSVAEQLWMVAQCLGAIPLLIWPSSKRAMASRSDAPPPAPTAYLNWRGTA